MHLQITNSYKARKHFSSKRNSTWYKIGLCKKMHYVVSPKNSNMRKLIHDITSKYHVYMVFFKLITEKLTKFSEYYLKEIKKLK